MAEEKTSRLSVDVSTSLKDRLSLLPWGTQRHVVQFLLEVGLAFFQTYGYGKALDALRDGKAKIIIEEDSHGDIGRS